MPFRRFFDRGAKETPKPAPVEQEAPELDEPESEEEGEPEVAAESDDADWTSRARAILPTGASTGSKRSEALYGAADATGPTHFAQAIGCRITDVDGNEYLDCTMALGSVALGYAEPNVTRAVVDAIAAGHVSGLSSFREVDIAERLAGIIPCADQVQFLKTGAEAMNAAVRLARTYTARDVVVACGYFGWLDWCADEAPGVLEGTRNAIRRVPFDDIPALELAVSNAGNTLAAIVIEPVIERLPSNEWVARARELATAAGAVLIFDEMKTGFRLRTAGFQEYSNITPDLAAFGKAMANGYPIAALVGHRDVMGAAKRTWISSTLAGEAASLSAVGAVLNWHNSAEICQSLWSIGLEMKTSINAAIEASGVTGVSLDGIDPMWMLRFDTPERERRFLELAAANGVLFKRGAYNYPALAHDEDAIREIEGGASAAFVQLRDEDNEA